jgi:hypothetical protein
MMRILALSLAALVLAASQVSSVYGQAAAAPTSHGSVLSGMIQSPLCSADTFASGDAVGDVSGSFFLAFDCQNDAIAGGTWVVLATADGPDGNTEIIGTIRGLVLHGSFERDGDGERVIVRDVALSITEGTGLYAAIVEGTGSLDATSDPDGAPQFVGTLGLTF